MQEVVTNKVQDITNENINRVLKTKTTLIIPNKIIQTINKMAIERMKMCFLDEVSDNDILFSINDWLLFALQKINGKKIENIQNQLIGFSTYEDSIMKEIDTLFQKVLNISENENNNNNNNITYYVIPENIITQLSNAVHDKEDAIIHFFQQIMDLFEENNINVVDTDYVSDNIDAIPLELQKKLLATNRIKEDFIKENLNKNENNSFLMTIEGLLNEVEYQIMSEEEIKQCKKMLVTILYKMEQM